MEYKDPDMDPQWDKLSDECAKFLRDHSRTTFNEQEFVECIIRSGLHYGAGTRFWRTILETPDTLYHRPDGYKIVPFETTGGYVYGLMKDGKFVVH